MTLKYNPKTQEWEGVTGGVDVQELAGRKPVAKVVPQIQKQKSAETIEKQIAEHPVYGYVKRLSWHIAEQYELETKPTSFIFRNRQGSCYQGSTHQIVYGYECAETIFNNGFNEYPTVAHVWFGQNVNYQHRQGRHQTFFKMESGKKGLWQLVLHEMAHFIDKGRNGHQSKYQETLKELIVLFPYNEVENV